MNPTKIEWVRNPPDNLTPGHTNNFMVGCSGKNCALGANCYARRMAKRQKHNCEKCYTFEPHFHWDRLNNIPTKKPLGIFLSMGDLFDEKVEDDDIFKSLSIIYNYAKFYPHAQHRFYLLTKQSRRLLDFEFPENVWLGVSINRKYDLHRIENLRNTNAKIKFISFEPLYEDLGEVNLEGIQWIIIGGQTKPDVEPDFNWIRNISRQAFKRQIPVFLKNNLKFPELSAQMQEFPKVNN